MRRILVQTRCLGALALLLFPTGLRADDELAYRLKPRDTIKLSVYGELDLDAEVRLTESGEATFSLINAVRLEGLTIGEATRKLTELYNARYLVDPQLSVTLLEASEEQVSVVGAVTRPGPVTIPRHTTVTLLDAIAIAGGLTPDADRSGIVLIRDNRRTSYTVEQLEKRDGAAATAMAGDRIHVATSRFAGQTVTVVGEVTRPGLVPFPLRGQLDLGTLLDSVGGVSAKADPSRILVRRGTRHYVADLATSARHALAPGDVVSVPPSAFVGKTVTVIGKVTRPGPVEFPASGELSALEAVAAAGGFADLANPRKVYLTRAGRKMKLNLKDVAEGKSPRTPLQPGDTIFVEVRLF